MTEKLVAMLAFSPAVREKWPTSVLTAEAHLTSEEEEDSAGPWSLRAELWAAPDATGRALAWVYFLSPNAPLGSEALRGGIELTLGQTKVATCRISVMQPPQAELAIESDFLEKPEEAVRAA